MKNWIRLNLRSVSAVCVIFYAFSVFILVIEIVLVLSSQPVVGAVIELKEETNSSGGSVLFRPVVSFQVAGSEIVKELNFAANPPPYEVGSKVDLRYIEITDGAVRLDSPFHLFWMSILVFSLTSLIFIPVKAIDRVLNGKTQNQLLDSIGTSSAGPDRVS